MCQRTITELVHLVEPHDLLFIVVGRKHSCSRKLNDGIIMLELEAFSIPFWFSKVQLCLVAFNAELKKDDQDNLAEGADSGLQSHWDTGSGGDGICGSGEEYGVSGDGGIVDIVMSDSEDSTVTYTEPKEGRVKSSIQLFQLPYLRLRQSNFSLENKPPNIGIISIISIGIPYLVLNSPRVITRFAKEKLVRESGREHFS
nr:hypothetical protein [Tanacetum cinerariifolium]